MKKIFAWVLELIMVLSLLASGIPASVAADTESDLSVESGVELFTGLSSTDFFLSSGTLADGEDHVVAIYSNTNNARMAVIPLQDGATYHIRVKNNAEKATNRMRIVTFSESFSEMTIAPLASENNKSNLDPGVISVAQDIIYWNSNKGAECVSEYEGTFVNTGNAKTMILFTAWGADPSLVEVSVKSEDHVLDEDTEEAPPSDVPGVELFTGFSSTDFFLKAGTLADGEEHAVAIYSNTNNARMAVIPLQDGATYHIRVRNNGGEATRRMRICTFAQTFSKLTIAPLASERNMSALDPNVVSVAQEIVFWDANTGAACVSDYEGSFVNTGNAKTMILFTAWGADPSLVEVSVKSEDHVLDSDPDEEDEMWEMINILIANMGQENQATQKILKIACNFWEHRDEFIYCSGTALDQPWNYWSYTGYVDSANTGKTVTAENAGFKRIDCSTFVRYVVNGIDYYSTPYYNALEHTQVEQGGLEMGEEVTSDDVTVCRTGEIPVRSGKKLILEAKSSSYRFTKIYGYNASGNVIQTLETTVAGTVFVPAEGVVYLRAEMKVASPSNYAPAAKGVPAAILKCLRIREDERLEINAECPLSGYRNANQMCKWFDENGYAFEYDRDSFREDDFRVGSVIYWGRTSGSWAYKNITHTSIYIGSGYVLHVSAPNGLIGGEGILIEPVATLMERYDIPLVAVSSPKYHLAEDSASGPAIVAQPEDAVVTPGEKASVFVEAQGEGLQYRWYFRNAGETLFHLSELQTNTYTAEMTEELAGREVYCVITDALGNMVTTKTAKLMTHRPGDINGDGEVNNKDVTRLFRHLSGYDVDTVEAALDVNGDGEVNNKDLTRLFRYLSGWDVEIY